MWFLEVSPPAGEGAADATVPAFSQTCRAASP
jgi:hypothetical protein